jgi:hypothetical protein
MRLILMGMQRKQLDIRHMQVAPFLVQLQQQDLQQQRQQVVDLDVGMGLQEFRLSVQLGRLNLDFVSLVCFPLVPLLWKVQVDR